MREYRIAYFTVDWNYELVESSLHGLKQYVDDHPNIHLCLFDCFGKDIGNAKDLSEYAIYNLPDLRDFDGLLIHGNQLVLQRVREELSKRVVEIGIPAISIGCPMEGFSLLTFDNQEAQRAMATHVIQHHGARKLVYVTGMLNNDCPEGQQRLDGFLEACREGGIPEENIEIIHGTWRTSDGAKVANRWLREKRPLPDAFISANDEMALGMLETFQEHGVRIPQDVIITGFDNLVDGELSNPRLTTVNCDMQKLNYFAMDRLIDTIEGRERRKSISFDYNLICSESCGCPNLSRPGMIQDKYFHQSRFLKNFYTLQDQLAEKLFEAESLDELMVSVENNQKIFGCSDVYLCMNDFYFDQFGLSKAEELGHFFGQEMVLTACRRLRRQNKDFQPIRFARKELLPAEIRSKERFLIFYPLHYNETSIGYLAMDGISEAAKMNLHESILNFLEIAIENVRKRGVLKRLNDVLDELYVRDALTGLYNRFGLRRQGQEVFDKLSTRDGTVQIIFADLDDMKIINDRFGHDVGDEALKRTAKILREVCGEEAFIMRYGGDEFVVITSGHDPGLAARIEREVAASNGKGETPYTLSVTAGSVFSCAEDRKTLEECVKAADTLMYAIKNQKKGNMAWK